MGPQFTNRLMVILKSAFGQNAESLFEKSPLLQYLNHSEIDDSGSLKNFYALYVLVEDYLKQKAEQRPYTGAFSDDLFKQQQQLPFGIKLQQEALNQLTNEEFHRAFPQLEISPILRDAQTNQYWINENLLIVQTHQETINIAAQVKQIIEAYIQVKQAYFIDFIQNCKRLSLEQYEYDANEMKFVCDSLIASQDAKIFEIASYAVLRYYYYGQVVHWGEDLGNLKTENLRLYKTTQKANDGMDFILRPTGRFFQIAENPDMQAYFINLDKLERAPISLIIPSTENHETIYQHIQETAAQMYTDEALIEKCKKCIEEIINIPQLLAYFEIACSNGFLRAILDEIVLQSKVEFNFLDTDQPL